MRWRTRHALIGARWIAARPFPSRSLQQFISIYVERWPLILGAIYIITIMLGRLYGVEGILGLFGKFRKPAAPSETPEG